MSESLKRARALMDSSLNRLAKWRLLLTGWQLGTRPKDDPEAQAVRDMNEARLITRVELNAITQVLIKKGIVTEEEWALQIAHECEHLQLVYEQRFPGIRATDVGLAMDPAKAATTMKGWKP